MKVSTRGSNLSPTVLLVGDHFLAIGVVPAPLAGPWARLVLLALRIRLRGVTTAVDPGSTIIVVGAGIGLPVTQTPVRYRGDTTAAGVKVEAALPRGSATRHHWPIRDSVVASGKAAT